MKKQSERITKTKSNDEEDPETENHSSEEETVSTVRIIDYTNELPNC